MVSADGGLKWPRERQGHLLDGLRRRGIEVASFHLADESRADTHLPGEFAKREPGARSLTPFPELPYTLSERLVFFHDQVSRV